MKTKIKRKFLLHPIFLTGLLLLFVNDHFLKWEYHNWLTGKLSDFVGLLIFPFFLAFLFPKFAKWMTLVTGLLFIFWKSPLSENLIEFYNQLAIIPITRVVDYTDLLALPMLFFAYQFIKKMETDDLYKMPKLRISPYVILLLSTFVFMATSPPPSMFYTFTQGNVPVGSKFKVAYSLPYIKEKLDNSDMKLDSCKTYTILFQTLKREPNFATDSIIICHVKQYVLEKDTMQNLDFTLRKINVNETLIHFNGLDVNLDQHKKSPRKLKRYYKNLIKKEWKRILE